MINLKNLKLNYVNLVIRFFYLLAILGVLILSIFILFSKKNENVKGISEINLADRSDILIPIIKSEKTDPQIYAKSYSLFDVESGSIIIGKNYDTSIPIASITKLMTAMIIASEDNLNNIVTIPVESTRIIGSSINLIPDEQITVKSLLTGTLINSGNDAAYALAYYNLQKSNKDINFSDAITKFVKKMNDYALKYNLQETKYLDPAGLNDNAYSSARDQGQLLSHILNIDYIREIINTNKTDIFSSDGKIKHSLDNSNRLVKEEMLFRGIIGGKTGFTPTAGHNLITAASRDGHTLIASIFSTFDTSKSASAIEAKKLLNWGYENINWVNYNDL